MLKDKKRVARKCSILRGLTGLRRWGNLFPLPSPFPLVCSSRVKKKKKKSFVLGHKSIKSITIPGHFVGFFFPPASQLSPPPSLPRTLIAFFPDRTPKNDVTTYYKGNPPDRPWGLKATRHAHTTLSFYTIHSAAPHPKRLVGFFPNPSLLFLPSGKAAPVYRTIPWPMPCSLLASWGYFSWTWIWVRVASA